MKSEFVRARIRLSTSIHLMGAAASLRLLDDEIARAGRFSLKAGSTKLGFFGMSSDGRRLLTKDGDPVDYAPVPEPGGRHGSPDRFPGWIRYPDSWIGRGRAGAFLF
jgi:hypothetical protein